MNRPAGRTNLHSATLATALLLSATLNAGLAQAHPGGRDAEGCHRCLTNCANWQLRENQRHCHAESSQASAKSSPSYPNENTGRQSERPWKTLRLRALDGDSLRGPDGTEYRLLGIDAPEWKQHCVQRNGQHLRCGISAHKHLQKLMRATTLQCQGDARDRYERILARCRLTGDRDLAAAMVAAGWAMSTEDRYHSIQARARRQRLGIWESHCVINPWEWRKGKRCP